MKKTVFLWTLLAGFLFSAYNTSAQPFLLPKGGDEQKDVVILKSFQDSVAYAYGIMIANQLKEQGVNKELLKKGMDDNYSGKPLMTQEQSKLMLKANQKMQREIQKRKNEELAKRNFLIEQEFLNNNAVAAGVKRTASGLQYKIVREGTGDTPTETSKVKVNFEGKLLNAKIFDTTFKEGAVPAIFKLNQVIPGWKEGLQLMKVGARYQFFVPSSLAYGVQGRKDIPPGSLLIFEVELLEILK